MNPYNLNLPTDDWGRIGWQVVVHFENAGPVPHSVAVLPAGAHLQVAPSGAPVFPGATAANFTAGLPKGAKQAFTFEAIKAAPTSLSVGVRRTGSPECGIPWSFQLRRTRPA